MNPLLFANWEKVGHIFCAIMWVVVFVLVLVIVFSHTHTAPTQHIHMPHGHFTIVRP